MTKNVSTDKYEIDDKAGKADRLYDKPLVAYKSGNSTVVTIPSVFGVKPGDILDIKLGKSKDEIHLKKLSQKLSKEEQIKEVERLSGVLDIPWLKSMTPEELDAEIDKMYDE